MAKLSKAGRLLLTKRVRAKRGPQVVAVAAVVTAAIAGVMAADNVADVSRRINQFVSLKRSPLAAAFFLHGYVQLGQRNINEEQRCNLEEDFCLCRTITPLKKILKFRRFPNKPLERWPALPLVA